MQELQTCESMGMAEILSVSSIFRMLDRRCGVGYVCHVQYGTGTVLVSWRLGVSQQRPEEAGRRADLTEGMD